MAWTTPRTWVPGELATAAMLDTHLRDNLNWLKDKHPYVHHNATYNDGSAHATAAGVQNNSGRLVLVTAGSNATVIPFYANAGGGVGFRWTVLDPDTGWVVNGNGVSFSFTDGSNYNTYTVAFSNSAGTITVTRTGGTTQYTMIVLFDLQYPTW